MVAKKKGKEKSIVLVGGQEGFGYGSVTSLPPRQKRIMSPKS